MENRDASRAMRHLQRAQELLDAHGFGSSAEYRQGNPSENEFGGIMKWMKWFCEPKKKSGTIKKSGIKNQSMEISNLRGDRDVPSELSTHDAVVGPGIKYDRERKLLTAEKSINDKILIFCLEKVCEGTKELNNVEGRGSEKWKAFIDERYRMVSPYKNKESSAKMYRHENKLVLAWQTNRNLWSSIMKEEDINIEDQIQARNNLHKIIEKVRRRVWHPIFDDQLTQEYIESKKKKLEIQDLYDYDMDEAVGPHQRCINNCKSPNIDIWIAYVVEKKDYSFDLKIFEKTEPIILMTLTISVDFSQESPYAYHMGIHRSLDYMRNKKKKISGKGENLGQLSLQLHGFASKGIDCVYGYEKRFIVTDPLYVMKRIFEKKGLKILDGKYKSARSVSGEEKDAMLKSLEKLSPERQKMAREAIKYGEPDDFSWLRIIDDSGEIIFIFVLDNKCVHPFYTTVSTNFEFSAMFQD